jgi:hypothetical protein
MLVFYFMNRLDVVWKITVAGDHMEVKSAGDWKRGFPDWFELPGRGGTLACRGRIANEKGRSWIIVRIRAQPGAKDWFDLQSPPSYCPG